MSIPANSNGPETLTAPPGSSPCKKAKAEGSDLMQVPLILVVDDRPDNLEVIQRTIEAWGYQTDGAATGLEALLKLDARCNQGEVCYDFLILDMDLPDVKGGTLGRWIRGIYDGLPFMYLTAYGKLPVFEEEARAVDALLFTKPINPETLKSVLESALEGYLDARTVGRPVAVPQVLREHIEEINRALHASASPDK